MPDILHTPIFSFKSKTTQIALILGLPITLLGTALPTNDLIANAGYLFGSYVKNAFIIYVVLAILFWIYRKIKKPVQIKAENFDVNLEKIKKNLKNTGSSLSAIGWITIIINAGLFLLGNFSASGVASRNLSSTVLLCIVGLIFVVLGNRIFVGVDKQTKLYLQISLGISIAVMFWLISSGGTVGLLFFLLVIYLISSLIKIGKALKTKEYSSILIDPKHKLNNRNLIVLIVIGFVLYLASLGIDSITNTSPITQLNSNSSKEDVIKQAVQDLKNSMSIPYQIDEATLLVDVTAEPTAIHYFYVLSGIDASVLSSSYLKNFLIKNICTNSDTKSLLNEDIDMKYTYTVKETNKVFTTSFSKEDCLNY